MKDLWFEVGGLALVCLAMIYLVAYVLFGPVTAPIYTLIAVTLAFLVACACGAAKTRRNK
jgi:hypothetical protein